METIEYPKYEDLKEETNMTASSLAKKFGASHRISLVKDDNNQLIKKKVQNNMVYHSILDDMHAKKKLDKFVYLNHPGKKRSTRASQYEYDGRGDLYIIPYHVWSSAPEKNNAMYRTSEYRL